MIRILLGKLEFSDPHTNEIVKGAVFGLASRVASVAIIFLFNVVLARTLGAEQAGLYYLGVAVVSVVSILSLMGIDNGSIRHAANMVAEGRWSDLATLYGRAVRIVAIASALWAVLIFASADSLASLVFLKPEFAEPLRRMSIALPFFTLIWLTSRYLQSASRPAASLFYQSASVPAVLLLILMLPLSWSAASIAIGYDVATAISLLLCVFAWHRTAPIAGEHKSDFDLSAVWRSSRLLFPANLVNKIVRPWTAVVCLGIWGSLVDVAWYSVAMRVAALVSFAVLPVNTILAPKIAVLAQRNELSTMYRLAARATLLIVTIAFPVLALVTLFPNVIMSMFGTEFSGAAKILPILVVGQVINVLTGPVQSLLVMTGNEHLNKHASFAGGIAILVLSAVLIPTMGAAGAAWATVGAIAVTNLLSAGMVWRLWRRSN